MLHRLAGNTTSAKALIDVFGARDRVPVPENVRLRYADHADVRALTRRTDGALNKGAGDALRHLARFAAFRAAGGSELRKGLPDDLPLAKGGEPDQDVLARFTIGKLVCKVRRSAKGVASMTIEGPDLPNPYHMLLSDPSESTARRVASGAVPLLMVGRVPIEGVFRRSGVLSAEA